MGNVLLFLIGFGCGSSLYATLVDRVRYGWFTFYLYAVLSVCAFVGLTSCVQVRVASTAVHGEHYATSEVQAGYGEGATMAQASETTSTATASRSANTVENLGAAGIGAIIGSGLLIP